MGPTNEAYHGTLLTAMIIPLILTAVLLTVHVVILWYTITRSRP